MGWRETNGRWSLDWICDACGLDLNTVRPAPMLRDTIWLRLASKKEVLCERCAKQRAKSRLGRNLAVTDRVPRGSAIDWWERKCEHSGWAGSQGWKRSLSALA
jgi:hypothetical protein